MTRRAPDDDALLAATAAGDPDAFAIFYRRHRDLVIAFLRARVREPELAFDLAAETFAAAILSAPRYEPGGAPAAAWLLGIARNKMLESMRRGRVEDHARRHFHFTTVELDDGDLTAIDERASVGTAALDALLAELPGDQRSALLARIVDEQEYADIATDLGCSEQVVRQRVSRGLRRLRARMEDRT